MTQRIFDVENEKDMADLWDILPDKYIKIQGKTNCAILLSEEDGCGMTLYPNIININWHLKTEITRPIQEATEADIGKLCKFWSGKDYAFGILKEIGDHSSVDVYLMDNSVNGIWFIHCRRLTKQEAEKLI